MKYLAITLLCACLAGCGENREECRRKERFLVDIDFRMDGGEPLDGRLSGIEAGVFDTRGNRLETHRLTAADIARDEGLEISLPAGDYRMVFWANMNGGTLFDGDRVSNACRDADADMLFYAPCAQTRAVGKQVCKEANGNHDKAKDGRRGCKGAPMPYYELTVARGRTNGGTVHFTHAHRTLSVYVEGLPSGARPTVEIEGLPAGVDYFGMGRRPETLTLERRTALVEKEGRTYACAVFRTLRFDSPEGIVIVVRDHAGEELFHTTLADALKGSSLDAALAELEMVLGFMDGGVSVTIPDWNVDHTVVELE